VAKSAKKTVTKKKTVSTKEYRRPPEVVLHVAPEAKTGGNGSKAKPFNNIATAITATKKYRKQGNLTCPVRILLQDGTYYLNKPLTLKPSDSGTLIYESLSKSTIGSHNLTIAAASGASPRISGGKRIENFQETMRGDLRVWVASIPQVKSGKWNFTQLWVNDERRYRPRLPKVGLARIESAPTVTKDTPWHEGQDRIITRPGDFDQWKNLTDIELVIMTLWIESRVGVKSFDGKKRMLTFDRPTFYRLSPDVVDDPTTLPEYYIDNVGEAMDSPGEWYLDRADGKLYYCPMYGETLENTEIIAPRLEEILCLQGQPENSPDVTIVTPPQHWKKAKPAVQASAYFTPTLEAPQPFGMQKKAVENITFDGIRFCHTEWRYPNKLSGSGQASWGVPGSIKLRYANHCVFRNCEFSHLGGYAMEMTDASCLNRIDRCRFYDLGGGGLKIWHGCRYNTLSDSEMSNGGRVFHSAVGILIGKAGGNSIVHNHIHNFYYTGISVGWTWGYAPNDAYGNIIEHNHIHDIGKGYLSDMGGIYLLGIAYGTRIRNNTIHDVTCRGYGGWAIYTDEGSTGVLIENNLAYHCNVAPFHQHFGRENVIRNNILAFGKKEQLMITRYEAHISAIFEQNIILLKEGKILNPINDFTGENPKPMKQWPLDAACFSRNLYWHIDEGTLDFCGRDFEEWAAAGMDKGSIVADPNFADPENGDFTLPADSPAACIGFIPFDFRDVGPRKSCE